MDYNINTTEVYSLLIVSVCLFLFGAYYFFIHNKCFRNSKHSFENRIMVFSAMLLIATWCMRYMIGISGTLYSDGKALSRPEEFFNSLVHTLQSFSMDEDYTEYLTEGKELMRALFSQSSIMPSVYSVYVSILNVVCPIVGGAILFAILTSFFPRIKLWFLTLLYWRPICYFSELNDASLSLARSIRNADRRFIKTLIIFSDVYTDSDDEEVSERIQKAKFLNAVCLKDDIADISLSRRHGKKIFLMDQNEIGNLQALATFKISKKYKRLNSKDEIYVFGNDDSNQMVVNSVCEYLRKQLGEDNTPFIMTVNGIRNLIYNLLEDEPLFISKGNEDDDNNKKLNIVIMGSGQIGTEMFLATYWCGQILKYDLCITIVSKEKEKDFKSRIDHINPDIFESGKPNSELLRIYKENNNPFAKPYFCFEYIETDIRQDDLYKKMLEGGNNGRMVDADYFVVSLGSDEDNLEIADKIARYISLARINDPKSRIPVAYVVYDDALNKLLKTNDKNDNMFVDMFPFGSLSDTYSYNKIVFEGIRNYANSIDDSYQKTISNKMASERSIQDYYDDSYSYWANIARAIHIKYKAFCVGKTVEEYAEEAKNENSELNKDRRLAWLEHRRWNAFMRVKGFKAPTIDEETGYISLLSDISDPKDNSNKRKHKNLALKLHPCIVECAEESGSNNDNDSGKEDMLDIVTNRLKNSYKSKNLMTGDFKKYDYPKYDFD